MDDDQESSPTASGRLLSHASGSAIADANRDPFRRALNGGCDAEPPGDRFGLRSRVTGGGPAPSLSDELRPRCAARSANDWPRSRSCAPQSVLPRRAVRASAYHRSVARIVGRRASFKKSLLSRVGQCERVSVAVFRRLPTLVVRSLEVRVAGIGATDLAAVQPGAATVSAGGQVAPGPEGPPNPAVAIAAVQLTPPSRPPSAGRSRLLLAIVSHLQSLCGGRAKGREG